MQQHTTFYVVTWYTYIIFNYNDNNSNQSINEIMIIFL